MQLAFTRTGEYLPIPDVGPVRSRLALSGVGDASATSIAAVAAQGAATTGSILAALSPGLAAAGPIGAAIAGLTAVGIAIASLFKGCGQTCVEATSIANQLETYWLQNLTTYMSAPVHYASMQQAALNNFMTGWNALQQGCSSPPLAGTAAGAACISERQRGGASAWCCNQDPNGFIAGTQIHLPAPVKTSNGMCTGCDAFVTFYDPIANDPNVVPDPEGAIVDPTTGQVTGIAPTTTSLLGTSAGSISPLLLIGGGLLAALLLLGSD